MLMIRSDLIVLVQGHFSREEFSAEAQWAIALVDIYS
jgi:hypothetical protein